MKTIIVAALAAVLAAALPAAAQTPLGPKLIDTGGMTGPEVAAWLGGRGFESIIGKTNQGGPKVDSVRSGAKFQVNLYDCEGDRCQSVQFSAFFDLKDGLTGPVANQWNKNNRYLKAYLNEDGDPYVQYDVNVNRGRTYSGLDDDFDVWADTLPTFIKYIGW
jgi:hypothetical protein